jgi:uncharacterized membrane protein
MLFFLSVIILVNGLNMYSSLKRYKHSVNFERAKVLEIHNEKLSEDPTIPGLYLGYQEVTIQITSGKYSGNVYTIRNPLSRNYNTLLKKNMPVIVSVLEDSVQGERVNIYTYKRDKYIYFLGGIFVITLLLVGKIKGFKSLLSLIFTGLMIFFFLIPYILTGSNPILFSIVTVILSIIASLFLINGLNIKTLAAIIGTASGVTISGCLSYLSGFLTKTSGLNLDYGEPLMHIADITGMQVKGIMFSIILIASLGAILDVGMSIASAAYELNNINKKLKFNELFNSTMNVGADIVGTMSNTLLLAFTGTMLPIILVTFFHNISYTHFMNLDYIVVEIIQALSGSVGIVITVPITAYVSTMLIKRFEKGGNKV